MKLTLNLKAVIVTQFKAGDDMAWLANLYKQPLERVEGVIREALKKQTEDQEK